MLHRRLISFTLMLLVIPIALLFTRSAAAQAAGELVVTHIDTSQFPIVSVQFSATDSTNTGLADLQADNLTLAEDGNAVSVNGLESQDAGVAIAILVDASGNILNLPGGSGKVRLEEARNAILDLADSDRWLDKKNRTDYVMVLVPQANGEITKLVPVNQDSVTNDYNELHNAVYQFKPAPIADTPLFRMLFQAIGTLKDDPKTAELRKAVIVFSDGINVYNDIQLSDAAAQANAAHIPVHTVFLAPENKATKQGNPDSLRRLSLLTSARQVWYNSPQAMEAIYSQIGSLRKQYTVTYESKINTSGKHAVTVGIKGGSGGTDGVTGSADFAFAIEPPTVAITEPLDGMRIDRAYPTYDSKPEQADPKSVDVKANTNFPDGHTRGITQYEWISDGSPVGVTTQPEFTWDISSFLAGPHTLRVTVRDDRGLTGSSSLLNLNVGSNIPEVPQQVRLIQLLQQYGFVPALALAFLALAFAVFVYIKRPPIIIDSITTVTTTLASAAKEMTEVFRRPQGKGGVAARRSNAYLEVIAGEQNRADIDLNSQHTKFGRDPNLVTVVFSDRSVSRLHAQISEEREGEYIIQDEGSTSGTYVNGRYVDTKDKVLLKNGDVISLGRIELKFHTRSARDDGMTSEQTEVMDLNSSKPVSQDTEPMEMPRKNRN